MLKIFFSMIFYIMSWLGNQNGDLLCKTLTVSQSLVMNSDLDMSNNEISNVGNISGINGQVDISGTVYIDNGLHILNNTNENTSLTTQGGITSYQNIIAGQNFSANGLNDAYGLQQGAITTTGGASISKNLYVGENITSLSTQDISGSDVSFGSICTLGGASIQKSVYIGGNLILNGKLEQAQNSTNSTGFEFQYAMVTGNGSYVTISVGLTNNETNTSNYAVFTSIYDGYGGTGNYYNLQDTSSAIKSIVISNCSPLSFECNFSKDTANNVYIYICFMIVYNPAFNYPKQYNS